MKNQYLNLDPASRREFMLKTAKATAQEKTSILLGKTAPELKWH